MRLLIILLLFSTFSCSQEESVKQATAPSEVVDLVAFLDTIWRTEQTPIRQRDSLMKLYGTASEVVQVQQALYKKNHLVNERKITELLDRQGWPAPVLTGERGNLTICNVLQHSALSVRQKYLPMMRTAVKAKKLQARLLARAEDRLATDRGELQLYGGQIKFYPATKTFDVWPIYDPEHVDERRAEIGLEPMAEFLKSRRFQLEWNVEKQIKRSQAFEKERQLKLEKER